MPKKPDSAAPDAAPAPSPALIFVSGTEEGLPSGLHLQGQYQAYRAPDGRLVVLDLPPALMTHYWPDLYPESPVAVPPPPTIAEV